MVNTGDPAVTDKPWPRPAYAWYVVTLLLLAYASGVIDRIVIGLLVEPIKADLQLSDTEMGVIQGLAFALFYTLFTLPVGLLIDRWRRVPVLWLGIAIWSAATVLAGFARSFWTLFAARVAVGAGEATTTPGSSSIIADYFPPTSRPRAFGVFMMGGSVGIGVAYLFGAVAISFAGDLRAAYPGLLGNFYEWQIVFILVGAPGLLLALLMALTIREPERRGTTQISQKVSLVPLWRELKTNRVALLAIIFGTIMNVMIVNAMLSWFPTLLVRVHHWEPAKIATALALVGVPVGLVSALTAGLDSVRDGKTRPHRRPHPRHDDPMCRLGHLRDRQVFRAQRPELALVGHVATSLFATWSGHFGAHGAQSGDSKPAPRPGSSPYTLSSTGLVASAWRGTGWIPV